MDLCVHFGKSAFIVFISSLYLYFGFSNKHFFNSIQFNHSKCSETTLVNRLFVSELLVYCCLTALSSKVMFLVIFMQL